MRPGQLKAAGRRPGGILWGTAEAGAGTAQDHAGRHLCRHQDRHPLPGRPGGRPASTSFPAASSTKGLSAPTPAIWASTKIRPLPISWLPAHPACPNPARGNPSTRSPGGSGAGKQEARAEVTTASRGECSRLSPDFRLRICALGLSFAREAGPEGSRFHRPARPSPRLAED